MSLKPGDYLEAYTTSGDTIIFGVPGSTSQGITALTITNGGVYTSVPSVTASNSPPSGVGFRATPIMGVHSVAITPAILNSPASISVFGGTGTGATFSPNYGAPNILGATGAYINPNSSPPPSLTITSSPPAGAGATYQISYGLSQISVIPGSPNGAYSSEPIVVIGGSGGGGISLGYGFTASHSAGIFGPIIVDSCSPSIPRLEVWNALNGAGFSSTTSFRPRMFGQTSGPNLFWHTADTPPTITKSPSFSVTGTGASFAPKFAIGNAAAGVDTGVEIVNGGSGYDTTGNGPVRVEFQVGSPPATVLYAAIEDDGAGALDLANFRFCEYFSDGTPSANITEVTSGGIYENYVGYFSEKPTIILGNQAGGSGADLNVHLMRLVRVENTAGSGYTEADMQGFTQISKIESTGIKLADATPEDVGPYFRMSHGQAISTTVDSEGSGYPWGAYLYWDGPNWATITNGVSSGATGPAITSQKKITTASVTTPGSYTSVPSITIAASPGPTSGNAPTLSLTRAQIVSVSNTARGGGYSATPSLEAYGFYEDEAMTTPANLSVSGPWLASISVTAAGTGYSGEETLSFGQGSGILSLKIVNFQILSGGINFSASPAISFSGGGQIVSAAATATLGNLATTSLPGLTQGHINLSTGDARQITYALVQKFYSIFSEGAFDMASATRSEQYLPNNERAFAYTFVFGVELPGAHALKNEV